jgi:hypothetical protein
VPRSIAANPASPQIAKRSLSCIFWDSHSHTGCRVGPVPSENSDSGGGENPQGDIWKIIITNITCTISHNAPNTSPT